MPGHLASVPVGCLGSADGLERRAGAAAIALSCPALAAPSTGRDIELTATHAPWRVQ